MISFAASRFSVYIQRGPCTAEDAILSFPRSPALCVALTSFVTPHLAVSSASGHDGRHDGAR